MKVWMVVRSILFGIAKLAGAVVMLGFSLGVIVGRKLKADSVVAPEDGLSMTPETTKETKEMAKAIENAVEQVIKDLEERTMVAVRLLDEAEEKIAHLKNILDVYEGQVLEESKSAGQSHGQSHEQSHEQSEKKSERNYVTKAEQSSKPEISNERMFSQKHALVFQLADEGLSIQEIAKKAGIGCGEVELILSLSANEGNDY